MRIVPGGVITGLPGTKKTLRTLLAVTAFNNRYPVVFAFPLRQLRDEVVMRFEREPLRQYRDKIVIVRAHDEVCPALWKRVHVEKKRYWDALAEHLVAVKEGREECGWKEEVRKAMDAIREKKVILTTHGIGIMMWLIMWAMRRRDVIFIWDEGDELFVNINDPIHLKDLEVLKELAPSKYKRILKLVVTPTPFKSHPNTALFIHSRLVWQMIKHSFFITATWPRSISEWFNTYEDYIIEEYRLRGQMIEDTIIILSEQLNWTTRKYWMRKLAPQLLEIAKVSIERFGTLAIIARNYEQNKILEELFTSAGYTVWSDRRGQNEHDYRDVDVVILTVLGKGYRGVNFFSRRTGADFPVILAFYQAHGPNVLHPIFHFMFQDDPEDEYSEMSNFIRDLVMAKNVQALFRFNRYRSRKHLLVLLDKRWWSAINYYVSYYYRRSNTLTVDIDNVASVVVPLIKSFNPEPVN